TKEPRDFAADFCDERALVLPEERLLAVLHVFVRHAQTVQRSTFQQAGMHLLQHSWWDWRVIKPQSAAILVKGLAIGAPVLAAFSAQGGDVAFDRCVPRQIHVDHRRYREAIVAM